MNLEIYEKVRAVPENAKKPIEAGRLKGKTDINPMWRLKTLTEIFGPCGIGWKYEVLNKELRPGANDEIAAFVDINLYVKIDGQWSEPIPGTGGSMFVAKESKGLYTSDECFKMALTDAISVACKALGFAADVYWQEDRTKYDKPNIEDKNANLQSSNVKSKKMATPEQINEISRLAKEKYKDKPDLYTKLLKELYEAGKISNPYPIDKNKRILWTVDDYERMKLDLESPFM